MGAMLACLAADTVCCLGTAACKCCFSVFGVAASTATRLMYSFLFLMNSVLAWLMLSDWAIRQLKDRFDKIPFYSLDCPEGYCYGTLATYRVTFSLALFHLILAVVTIGVRSSRDFRAKLQNLYWGPKLVKLILFYVMSFYIPNGFFLFYGKLSMFAGAFFILIQLVLLIDMAYQISAKCLQEYENSDDRAWIIGLSGGTILLMIAFIVITGFLYAHFGKTSCGLNQFFITFNLVLALVIWLVSIHPQVQEVNPQVGLPQAAFVSAYAIYLLFSGMSSEPEEQCNPLITNEQPRTANIIIGVVITFLALAYSASSAATQGHAFMGLNEPAYRLTTTSDSGGGGDDDAADEFDDESEGINYSYAFFHLTFAVAAMYVAMLLTNWDPIVQSSRSSGDGGMVTIEKSWTAVWIKIITSWLTMLMYLWTILAPVLLPDREFF